MSSLLRFDLAYEVLESFNGKAMYSFVPSMLPRDDMFRSTPLDGAIGPLAPGQSEIGVRYHLEHVPPDMWPSLVLRHRAMVVPETCTRTSVVLQWGSQRGMLSLDVAKGHLTLVCRGPAPVELRVRFHWALVELVGNKYPFLDTAEWLHTVCHVCHKSSQLFGLALQKVLEKKKPFRCSACILDKVLLSVEDLVVKPFDVLEKALATPLLSSGDTVQLCSLAARLVDTTSDMCDRHGHRAQLWLPVLSSEHAGGAFTGVGVGAGSGATDGTSVLPAIGGPQLGWVSVCEDPNGWHVACNPVFPVERLTATAFEAVLPVLQRVAAVVLAVADFAGSPAPSEWRDWKAGVLPHLHFTAGDGRAGWVAFCRSFKFGQGTALRGRCGSWACLRHGDITKVSASDVSLSCYFVLPFHRLSRLRAYCILICVACIVYLCLHMTSTGTLRRTSHS